MADERPYRPNVGICLINPDGHVWMGKTPSSGPEIVTPGREWQMPQGGIEVSEDIVEAARRELWEETGVTKVDLLQVTEEWWTYDFPSRQVPSGHKLDPFKGQKQKWVAFRFTGENSEVDISARHADEPREFFDWKWMDPIQALDQVVSFKIDQYVRVF